MVNSTYGSLSRHGTLAGFMRANGCEDLISAEVVVAKHRELNTNQD